MSIYLGDLSFMIRGDSSKMTGDLNKAGAQAKGWGKALSASLKEQLNFAAGQLMATGIQRFSDAMQNYVKDAIKSTQRYTEEIADLSRQTGTTLEDSSRLYNVADDLRVEYGDLSTALKIYAKTLKDSGSQEQLSVKTLARLSDEYLKLAPGVERTNFLLNNFGRGGLAMARIMEKGSAELLKMNDAVEKSLIVDQAAIDRSEEYRLALDAWDDSMLGVKMTLMIGLMPELTKFSKWITKTGIPALEGITNAFNSLPEPLKWVTVGLAGLLILALKIGPTLLGIVGIINMFGEGGALAGVGVGIKAFIMGVSPVLLLIAALGALIYLLSKNWTQLGVTISQIGQLTIISARQLAIDVTVLFGTMALNAVLSVRQLVTDITILFGTMALNAVLSVRQLVTDVTILFGTLAMKIALSVKQLATDVRVWFGTVGANIVQGIGDGIVKGWSWLITMVQNLVQSMLAAAKAALGISSPSKAFRDQVGLNAALGMEHGFTDYVPKMAANMRGSLKGLAPAVMGAGNISVGHVEFHGALSEAEQDKLDKKSGQIARRTILEALA